MKKYRLRWPFAFEPALTEMEKAMMGAGFICGLTIGGSLMAVVMSLGG